MLFSQRQGLKPAQKLAQRESMDEELRNGLWNVLDGYHWSRVHYDDYREDILADSSNLNLFRLIWHSFFKKPLDTLHVRYSDNLKIVRNWYFEAAWNEVYDFLEFMLRNGPKDHAKDFASACNVILARESAAYRIVGESITEMTSETEIQEVERALSETGPLGGVQAHLTRALELLSSKTDPDYRNSIKESISAIEGVSRLLSGDKQATLGGALAVLEERGTLHGALKKALGALYGYTSDTGGIRHAMLEAPNLTAVDARFMLVVCSTFVNYLVGKASELGIALKET